VRIFDRIKNLFKLQQGEYIAPEKVEGVLGLCFWQLQVFVTGDSDQAFCVAVVVPDLLKLTNRWKADSSVDTSSLPAILQSAAVCDEIFADLQLKLRESKLSSFEKPQRIFLSPIEMTTENECITPTLKVRRNFARRMFSKEIQQL